MNNRRFYKGFTLAELLIVVAIISVLVGVSIPVFNSQLEKSREAVDIVNLRNAYSAGALTYMLEEEVDGEKLKEGDVVYYDIQNFVLTRSENIKGYGKGTANDGGTIYPGYNASVSVKDDYACVEIKDGNVITYFSGNPVKVVIDYTNRQSVANYIKTVVEDIVKDVVSGNNSEFKEVITKNNTSKTTTVTLPNGTEVELTIYGRNYNSFEDVKTRSGELKASAIYNVDSKNLGTIIYFSDQGFSSWSYGSEEWNQDNSYVNSKGQTVNNNNAWYQ